MIPNDDILLNDHPTYNRNNKKYQDHQQIETPDYFDMITEEDQIAYRKLQSILSSPDNRYARNKKVEIIQDSIINIEKFCIKNDENDWKRSIVCGFIHLNKNDKLKETIAINIRQFKILISKSKSTINGSLSKMGFATFPTKGDDQNLILTAVPYFEGKYFELRQWTIRKRKIEDIDTSPKKENNELELFSLSNDNDNDEFKFDQLDIFENDYLPSDFKFDDMKNNEILYSDFENQYGVFVVNQPMNEQYSMFSNIESIIKENKLRNDNYNLICNNAKISAQCYIVENIWKLLISSPYFQFFFICSLLLIHFNNNMATFLFRYAH